MQFDVRRRSEVMAGSAAAHGMRWLWTLMRTIRLIGTEMSVPNCTPFSTWICPDLRGRI